MQTTFSLLAYAAAALFSTTTVLANQMTPIFAGAVTGSPSTSCSGEPYTDASMFVAIDPDLFTSATVCPTSSTGTGYAITIECNGQTVQAQANDKCMGCNTTHIDVAPAVWQACGFELADTDPKAVAFTLG